MANERRLIDLDELIETLKATEVKEYFHEWNDMTPLGKSVVLRVVRAYREIVLKQSTVDAVEVVRCEKCYWNDRDGRCMNPKCGKSWYGCPVPDEHYCSYGERRNENP